MLRESMKTTGREVDLRGIGNGFDEGVDIPNAAGLVDFAEAVVLRDEKRTASARTALLAALGHAGLVDAAAVVAAFHGFVRVADATGIPYETASRGRDDPELRELAGVNEFHRVKEEA